jgi:hypothetical protein
LAATQSQYHAFLDALYDELFFDSEFSPDKVEKIMSQDTEYCLKILSIALENRFDKIRKGSKFTQIPNLVYFPNEVNFLKIVMHFILTNTQQMADQVNGFVTKVHQVWTLMANDEFLGNR